MENSLNLKSNFGENSTLCDPTGIEFSPLVMLLE
jgi:hypothetical protein